MRSLLLEHVYACMYKCICKYMDRCIDTQTQVHVTGRIYTPKSCQCVLSE